MNPHGNPRATLGGVAAIALWSTNIVFSRLLIEDLGIFLAPGLICLLGGTAGFALARLRGGRGWGLGQLSPAYLLVCGGCFVVYMVFLYSALGLPKGRMQVLGVAMANYLWPTLTLVFSVWLFGSRARRGLWPGLALATAGVVLAKIFSGDDGGQAGGPGFWSGLPAYGLGVGAAVLWALYSNFSRRLGGRASGNAVPLFLLACSAVFLPLGLLLPGKTHWSPATVAVVLWMGLLPTLLAYRLWDDAVRHGNIVLVTTLSYLIPLLAALVGAVVFGVRPHAFFWVGCGLTIAGAWVCSRSVAEAPAPESAS